MYEYAKKKNDSNCGRFCIIKRLCKYSLMKREVEDQGCETREGRLWGERL